MCNISGYVGSRQAAPILVDMLMRQEGFAGGYYTGIVTWHEGKFYSYKLTGDTQKLLDTYDIMHMPGTVGIIHSRSKAGGGDKWSHPFAGCDPEGNILNYYVANGGPGIFKPVAAAQNAVALELEAQGYHFSSRDCVTFERYQTLSDGMGIHTSDTMAQLIARNQLSGLPAHRAMEKGFCDMPSELAALLLSAKEPGKIFFCVNNRPMTIARAEHGMYLNSAALALPEDAQFLQQLPMHTSGCVCADGYEIYPFEKPMAEEEAMDARVIARAYEIIVQALSEGEKPCKELNAAIRPLFGDKLTPCVRTTYEVLYALHREGRLKMRNIRVEGAFAHLTAPQTLFSLQ